MRTVPLALVATLVTASASLAQRDRQIALPDTAGANFPIADTATKSGTPGDYDPLSLYTYRLFDPERKIWQMLGARSTGGEFAPGPTWSNGSNRYAIQHNGSAIVRIRYFAIEPDRFLWRADRSTDGGKTWLRDAMTMEASRVGK